MGENILLSYSEDGKVIIKCDQSYSGTLCIPEGVTKINKGAFSCCNIQYVTLPLSLEIIGEGAFEHCANLKKLAIPKGYHLEEICKNAFSFSGLCEIEIGVEGEWNTEDCIEHPIKLADYAFSSCINLKKIEIKELIVISPASFYNCPNLEIVEIEGFYNDTESFSLIHFMNCPKAKVMALVPVAFGKWIPDWIDINKVAVKKSIELKAMSIYYHSIGLNLTKIKGECCDLVTFKKPYPLLGMNIDDLQDKRQELQYLLSQDWKKCTGLGLVLGWKDLRVLEFDNVDYEYWYPSGGIRGLAEIALDYLKLPHNYPWIVLSGSRNGFHIIFRCKDFVESKELYAWGQMELHWRGHMVLPPSIHVSGQRYVFMNEDIPTTLPDYVTIADIDNSIRHFEGKNVETIHSYHGRHFYLFEEKKRIGYNSSYTPIYSIDSIGWLSRCSSPEAINTLAIRYLLGDGVKPDKDIALRYFLQSETRNSFLNIASIMSVGYFEGSIDEIEHYINKFNREESGYEYSVSSIDFFFNQIRSNATKYVTNHGNGSCDHFGTID